MVLKVPAFNTYIHGFKSIYSISFKNITSNYCASKLFLKYIQYWQNAISVYVNSHKSHEIKHRYAINKDDIVFSYFI